MKNLFEFKSANFVGGRFVAAPLGLELKSINPYDGSVLWVGNEATQDVVQEAIECGRSAFDIWSSTSYEDRKNIIRRFTDLVKQRDQELTELVSLEAGKPAWEAKTEVNALITKFTASVEAYETRCASFGREVKGRLSKTRFVPHGCLAVIGPFNFPLSMANGHIMPALLAGNTIIYKPSEQTPLCGLAIAYLWFEAGLPSGVLNCLSGGAGVAKRLVSSSDLNGVLFVGGHAAGMSILEATKSHPEKIVALEMGGNNPLVVNDFTANKLDAVLKLVIQSSLISGGQRCSAARRLIVKRDMIDFVESLKTAFSKVRFGNPIGNNDIYYGPLITESAASRSIQRFSELVDHGAKTLLEPKIFGPNNTLVSPGLIELNDFSKDKDEEIFGPILKVYYYDDLDNAIDMANDTKFGLAAGIITGDAELYEKFFRKARAGIVNWNQPLTGATTFAPFGGIGQSGNFRPAGYLSADYCSYAVASFETELTDLDEVQIPGVK
jgi:succinylglutamic semialdehyde dehydrogenase